MACARTMSGMVMIGKSSPHTLPVAGLVEAGPVDPMQPPITFEQMMKYLSVSSGRPGPTMISHQPGLPVSGCDVGDVLIERSAHGRSGWRWSDRR